MFKILKNKTFLLLLGIFAIGLILKLVNFWDIQIFAYDQARDAQRIFEIISGNPKIVGPETDIKGVFNGPFMYYLLAPFYFFSNFNPNIVSLFMVFVNLSGIFLVYYISWVLFKNRNVGLISAFLWAISYEQANFARFISNASFMSIAALVFFLGIALYFIRKNKWGLPISIIGVGLGAHFNIYLGYLILFYPLFFYVYRVKPTLKQILGNALLFLAILSPFILAELKWDFMSLKAFLAYFGQHAGESSSLLSNLNSYPLRLQGALSFGFFSFDRGLALVLFVTCIIYLFKTVKERKSLAFLFVWTFSTFPLFFFKSGVLTAEVINTSIFGALTIVFGLTIYKLLTSKLKYLGLILLAVIFVSNLNLFVKDNFKSYHIFSLQTLVLEEEKALIDYTYNSSKGKEFSICAVTNPLFVNTLWSYLYNFYGKQKYGYAPYWAGPKQDLNATLIPYDTNKVNTRYLIIEPFEGLVDFAVRTTIHHEDQISVLKETKKFGNLTVQKRELNLNKKAVERNTQRLAPRTIEEVNSLLGQEQRYSCYNNY